MTSTKLAVFGLPNDFRDGELKELFEKFGQLERCVVRETAGGSTMGFLEFDDSRDAEDALEETHGKDIGDGFRLRVEYSRSGLPGYERGTKGRGRGRSRYDSRGRGGRYNSRRRSDSRDRRFGKKGKSKGKKGPPVDKSRYYKVKIVGMPLTSSWQDMKDFFRRAGSEVHIRYTEVIDREEGIGIGGFDTQNEAELAEEKLNGEYFRARNGDKEKVKCTFFESPSAGGGGSRSRSRSKGMSDGGHSEEEKEKKKKKKHRKHSDDDKSRSRSRDKKKKKRSKSSRSRS